MLQHGVPDVSLQKPIPGRPRFHNSFMDDFDWPIEDVSSGYDRDGDGISVLVIEVDSDLTRD